MENNSKQTLEQSEKNEREQPSRVNQLAADFHTIWQESSLNEDGTRDPVIDEIPRGSETLSVDIANTDFFDLPTESQAGYIEGAQKIVDLNESFKEEFGEDLDIHDEDLQGYVRSSIGKGLAETWLAHDEWTRIKQSKETDLDNEV